MSTLRRGQELQRLARACLEARGCQVELVHRAVRWIRQDDGQLKPISISRDLFGLFDLIAVGPRWRGFAQVTTEDNFHARRAKILATAFPVCAQDLIMAHRRGTRVFRVARGPLFLLSAAESWEVPKAPVRGSASA